MRILLEDLAFVARRLLRSRRFIALTVPVLGLAMAGAFTMAAIVSAILLEPLPYRDAERLVRIGHQHAERGIVRSALSLPDYADVAALDDVFDASAAVAYQPGQSVVNAELRGEPQQLEVAYVSSGFFDTLQATPRIGRAIAADEFTAGQDGVLVLSQRAWAEFFGRDASVLNSTVRIRGRAYVVIGVMAADFQYPDVGVDAWLPLSNVSEGDMTRSRGFRWLDGIARLQPGIGQVTALQRVDALYRRLAQDYPDSNRNYDRAVLEPLFDTIVARDRTPLTAMFAATALMVIVGSINLAGMLLVRAHARRRDDALQQAIGASSLRIARQAALEAFLIATVSGVLALVLAAVVLYGLSQTDTLALSRDVTPSLDLRTGFFALFTALASGTIAAAWPLLSALRAQPARVLAQGAQGAGPGDARARGSLVVAQIAIICALAYACGLVLESMRQVSQAPIGLEPEQVLTLRLRLQGEAYADPEALAQRRQQILDAVAALPAVVAVGGSKTQAVGEVGERYGVRLRDDVQEWSVPEWGMLFVSPDYFRSLGVTVQRGAVFGPRTPPEGDLPAIVNNAFVERFLPGSDPLQRRLPSGIGRTLNIVGVVGDVRHAGPAIAARPTIYLPLDAFARQSLVLQVRLTSADRSGIDAVKQAIRSVDPRLPIAEVRWLDERIHDASGTLRLLGNTLGLFLILGALIGGFGTYGVVRYVVQLQQRDFAVRSALGAPGSALRRRVLGYALRLGLYGVLLALPLAWIAARLVGVMLVGVNPMHVGLLAAAVGASLLLAFVAGIGPAIAAARTPPAMLTR